MNYVIEDLAAENCLKVQDAILKHLAGSKSEREITRGALPRLPYIYATPLGEINEGDYWVVDRENDSWLVQLDSGMPEMTVFVLFFDGKLYEVKSFFRNASTLESLTYIEDVEDRELVERVVIVALDELGRSMNFKVN
ncbi:hypothetical protein O5O45_13755 [Hahella aquimaris]|uniref:hypothetical protein n=1 Tax=Hahella sp. HNIBRBA332 TaxID=3015983 RepID=UPI00273B8A20|nr:hypothetical protein [Hahella sp. HNIBRBA332]WLQ16979.1 hypothetical protein O5O45_13755 [Hahella sp. HNIBRBA332]